MNYLIVGTSLYLSMSFCKSWSCMFLAAMSASWLIFNNSILCCNWASCLAACLFTLAFSISSYCSSCEIFSSFSFNKTYILVAFPMAAVSYALVNYENLVKFSAALEGMSFQTISIESFLGENAIVSILLLFLCLLTTSLCSGL